MNSAARVVSNTRKFNNGLSQLVHNELHWLDVADRVQFKLTVLAGVLTTDALMEQLRSTWWKVAHKWVTLIAESVESSWIGWIGADAVVYFIRPNGGKRIDRHW